jgi:hypothetical protein
MFIFYFHLILAKNLCHATFTSSISYNLFLKIPTSNCCSLTWTKFCKLLWVGSNLCLRKPPPTYEILLLYPCRIPCRLWLPSKKFVKKTFSIGQNCYFFLFPQNALYSFSNRPSLLVFPLAPRHKRWGSDQIWTHPFNYIMDNFINSILNETIGNICHIQFCHDPLVVTRISQGPFNPWRFMNVKCSFKGFPW